MEADHEVWLPIGKENLCVMTFADILDSLKAVLSHRKLVCSTGTVLHEESALLFVL